MLAWHTGRQIQLFTGTRSSEEMALGTGAKSLRVLSLGRTSRAHQAPHRKLYTQSYRPTHVRSSAAVFAPLLSALALWTCYRRQRGSRRRKKKERGVLSLRRQLLVLFFLREPRCRRRQGQNAEERCEHSIQGTSVSRAVGSCARSFLWAFSGARDMPVNLTFSNTKKRTIYLSPPARRPPCLATDRVHFFRTSSCAPHR